MNQICHTVKNLLIIDYKALILFSNEQLKAFCTANGLNCIPFGGYGWANGDSAVLFNHYFFNNLLKIYVENDRSNILIYWQDSTGGVKIEKQIFNFIKNRLKMPVILTNIDLDRYKALLDGNSPEYDDITNNTFNLVDTFPKLKKYFETKGLTQLYETYADLKQEAKLFIK